MLAKKYRLSSHSVQEVFKKGKWRCQGIFCFKILKNTLTFSRFAVIVSRKVTLKAVKRNKIRRQIMECVRLNYNLFPKGFDIVIIPQPTITQKKFSEIKRELRRMSFPRRRESRH